MAALSEWLLCWLETLPEWPLDVRDYLAKSGTLLLSDTSFDDYNVPMHTHGLDIATHNHSGYNDSSEEKKTLHACLIYQGVLNPGFFLLTPSKDPPRPGITSISYCSQTRQQCHRFKAWSQSLHT